MRNGKEERPDQSKLSILAFSVARGVVRFLKSVGCWPEQRRLCHLLCVSVLLPAGHRPTRAACGQCGLSCMGCKGKELFDVDAVLKCAVFHLVWELRRSGKGYHTVLFS